MPSKKSPVKTKKKTTKSSSKAKVGTFGSGRFKFSRFQLAVFVVLFAGIGGYLLFAGFADSQPNFVVGMGSGGAVSASRDATGSATISGTGSALTFQITPDNMLQCTNTNAGKITTAQLTPEQTNDIANKVIAAGIQSQSDTVVAKGQGVLGSTWVTVNANGVNKTVNITGTVESTPFGRAVSAIAREACKQATAPLIDQVSTGAGKKHLSKTEGQALAKKIENAINAKVYASGYGPRMETAQYVGINYWRDRNGVSRNLKTTECLRDSARKHAADMAAYNTMSHQLPNEPYFGTRIDNQCGKNSWTWAGENIAWNSDTSLNGVALLIDLMASEKPPENGHRLNDLSTNYTNVGAGAYFDDTNGKIWITEDFAAFNNYETTYAQTQDWNLNGSATVSSSTSPAAANVYVKPGQSVVYHFRIANSGPSSATYTQYRIWKHYSANGTLLSSSYNHGQSTEGTGWGKHGDGWPASTAQYAFGGRYYDDFTADSDVDTIPGTALNGEKFCRYVHYNNAFGPGDLVNGTTVEDSNMACAIVKI